MPTHALAALVQSDVWGMSHGRVASDPFVLRYRTPLPDPSVVQGYNRVLRLLWAYAGEDAGVMPDAATSHAMIAFENDLCSALEGDLTAVLLAVLTFDGARQWVLYTRDIAACSQRINALPQQEDPYPLELDTFNDPSWDYVRDLLSQHTGAA